MAVTPPRNHSSAAAASSRGGWRASREVVERAEQSKAGFNYREEHVPAYTVPDPLLCGDGTRIASVELWETRGRPETLESFRRMVYGRSPGVPEGTRFEVVDEDTRALGGDATQRTVQVRVPLANGGVFAFESFVFIPNARRGPAPAFLLINNRPPEWADPTRRVRNEFWPVEELIARGYATAAFHVGDVQPDEADGVSRGLIAALGGDEPRAGDGWATIGAWAWVAGRVMDYLQAAPEIDGARVAVVGHSRGGKTALWAGAQDPRFSLVVSNESGCLGAALGRRVFGETFAAINGQFPHWFCGNFKAYNGRERDLPVDQHQLLALIAPRAVYVASADEDLWADPRGEFLSLAHAGPVYGLYGLPTIAPDEMPPLGQPLAHGKMGYHIRRGEHELTMEDWKPLLGFADRLWKRE
jgi:hypothetical protein